MTEKNVKPLSLNGLTKFYGTDRGIEDVSLEVNKGEVFGFLGPNGAGKTTTIRSVLDFIRPTSGSATIFGLDSHQDSVQIKERVGYLSGDAAFYENLSGKQLIDLLDSLGENTQWEYVDHLKNVLKAELNRPLKKLSRGNKQKIGLIQAFMHKPDLLLLDEPTSGLDPLMQETFYELVREARDDGRTIFVSSHNLPEVQRICNRAGFIRDGKLIGIEEISKLQDMNVHNFTVWFGQDVEEAAFKSIKSIESFTIDGRIGNFTVTGKVDEFIKALATTNVDNLDQSEASLEDMFMHYYKGENQ